MLQPSNVKDSTAIKNVYEPFFLLALLLLLLLLLEMASMLWANDSTVCVCGGAGVSVSVCHFFSPF